MTNHIEDMQELIELTGEWVNLEVKANVTYIIYQADNGQIVKEYANGAIEPIEDPMVPHE